MEMKSRSTHVEKNKAVVSYVLCHEAMGNQQVLDDPELSQYESDFFDLDVNPIVPDELVPSINQML